MELVCSLVLHMCVHSSFLIAHLIYCQVYASVRNDTHQTRRQTTIQSPPSFLLQDLLEAVVHAFILTCSAQCQASLQHLRGRKCGVVTTSPSLPPLPQHTHTLIDIYSILYTALGETGHLNGPKGWFDRWKVLRCIGHDYHLMFLFQHRHSTKILINIYPKRATRQMFLVTLGFTQHGITWPNMGTTWSPHSSIAEAARERPFKPDSQLFTLSFEGDGIMYKGASKHMFHFPLPERGIKNHVCLPRGNQTVTIRKHQSSFVASMARTWSCTCMWLSCGLVHVWACPDATLAAAAVARTTNSNITHEQFNSPLSTFGCGMACCPYMLCLLFKVTDSNRSLFPESVFLQTSTLCKQMVNDSLQSGGMISCISLKKSHVVWAHLRNPSNDIHGQFF